MIEADFGYYYGKDMVVRGSGGPPEDPPRRTSGVGVDGISLAPWVLLAAHAFILFWRFRLLLREGYGHAGFLLSLRGTFMWYGAMDRCHPDDGGGRLRSSRRAKGDHLYRCQCSSDLGQCLTTVMTS